MGEKDYQEHPNNSIHSQTRKAVKVTKIKSEKEIRKLEKIGSRAINSYIATIRDLSASSSSISTPVQKILREEAFTKLLQTFLGFGNSEAYESFELGLKMNDKLCGSNHD